MGCAMEKKLHDNGTDGSTAGVAIADRTVGSQHVEETRGVSHGGAPVLLSRDRLRWFGLGAAPQDSEGNGEDDDAGE
jgi:hypothetical protein